MFGGVDGRFIVEIMKRDGAYFQPQLTGLETPPWFFIRPEFLVSIPVELKYYDYSVHHKGSFGHEDHPSFRVLRQHLERNGFIKTQNWANGDRVLKPFYLNNYLFVERAQFLCATAMGPFLSTRGDYNDGYPKSLI